MRRVREQRCRRGIQSATLDDREAPSFEPLDLDDDHEAAGVGGGGGEKNDGGGECCGEEAPPLLPPPQKTSSSSDEDARCHAFVDDADFRRLRSLAEADGVAPARVTRLLEAVFSDEKGVGRKRKKKVKNILGGRVWMMLLPMILMWNMQKLSLKKKRRRK